MQVADEFLLRAGMAGAGASAGTAMRPLLIEPWISAVPDVVVCESAPGSMPTVLPRQPTRS